MPAIRYHVIIESRDSPDLPWKRVHKLDKSIKFDGQFWIKEDGTRTKYPVYSYLPPGKYVREVAHRQEGKKIMTFVIREYEQLQSSKERSAELHREYEKIIKENPNKIEYKDTYAVCLQCNEKVPVGQADNHLIHAHGKRLSHLKDLPKPPIEYFRIETKVKRVTIRP